MLRNLGGKLQQFKGPVIKFRMQKFNPVTHVIFDLDGLLIDSETVYKIAIDKIVAKYGKVYTDDVRLKVTGTVEQDTARILVEELNIPKTPEEFFKECFEQFKTVLNKAELKPGAEKLIRHFHKHTVPIAVATSSGKESCEIKLENYRELFSLFNHMVMGSSDSEVVNGKPAPDIFIIAAKRFPDSPSVEKCLVFEDSFNGVLAAKAAKMQVVMVPEAIVTEDKRKQATLVLNSLDDFVPEDFGLPPFNS